MEEDNNEVPPGKGLPNQNHSSNNQSKGLKGKSCKGCLYYSSAQNSRFHNPTCVGISKNVQVNSSSVREFKSKVSKENDNLTEFRYTCVGYSLHLDNRDSKTDQDKPAYLPVCAGLELLLRKKPSSAASAPAPAYGRTEAVQGNSQPQTSTPAHPIVDEYLSRFKRNASLVAMGVVKNVNRVINYIRDGVKD